MNGKTVSYIGGLYPRFKRFHSYRLILINLQIFLCQWTFQAKKSRPGLQFDLILTA